MLPEHPPHPLQAPFREAMSACAAGVHIITTNGQAGRYGITMTAVTSITDQPPTVMLCINNQARIVPLLEANGRLCINVLAANQQDAAEHFAGITRLTPEERFLHHIWAEGPTGQPQVTGALAHMHGDIVQHTTVGTHRVLFVEIGHISVHDTDSPALTYFRRRFGSLV